MTVIVWTDIPVLLDPIICHASKRNLEFDLPEISVNNRAKRQQAMFSQQRRWRSASRQTDGEGSENISIGAKATRAELQA